MSALLRGLTLPEPLGRGRPHTEQVEAWLQVVETLIGRGVDRPGQMAALIGVHRNTAARWIGEVRARWAQALDAEKRCWRREKLYAEADEVARHAWEQALDEERGAIKAQLLRIVLESNKRKAALCGLDSVGMKVETRLEVNAHTRVDVVASVESDLALAPGALAQIGRDAAQLLSAPQVIDVSPAEDDE